MALVLLGDSQACGASAIVTHVVQGDVRASCKIGIRTGPFASSMPLPVAPGDQVLVYLGSNECTGAPDPNPLLDRLFALGITPDAIVWVGPPSIRAAACPAADRLAQEVPKRGVAFLDSRSLHLTLTDGIHPGPSEHARWLRAALALLASPPPTLPDSPFSDSPAPAPPSSSSFPWKPALAFAGAGLLVWLSVRK